MALGDTASVSRRAGMVLEALNGTVIQVNPHIFFDSSYAQITGARYESVTLK